MSLRRHLEQAQMELLEVARLAELFHFPAHTIQRIDLLLRGVTKLKQDVGQYKAEKQERAS